MINLIPLKEKIFYDTFSNKEQILKIYDASSLFIEHEFATHHMAFALRLSGDKMNGTYVEIGSGHWQNGNNTYLLEKEYGWKGLAIDINKESAEKYNENRFNKCYNEDALNFNWQKVFEENNFSDVIDFLQIDIDTTPEHSNLMALLNLPLSRYRFNTISIEHAASYGTPGLIRHRDMQREILNHYGYILVAGGRVDDWWVHKDVKLISNQYLELSSSVAYGEIKI